MSFWAELKRRNVFRVAAGYAVVAWLIVQIVSALNAPLRLPEWFDTVAIVLVAIGFPIALLVAWAFELTPDGIKRTPKADGTAVGSTTGSLDYVLIAALVVVGAATVWNGFTGLQSGAVPGPSVEATTPQSVAVLPFEDMSPGRDQGYFGDGIAEELINELTHLSGLSVAGRTSSFSFKGKGENLRSIGATLGVDTILEGSVRKDGDRVRITAQLVNAADGYHVWSQRYDRELTDIFAIQEEIARSVAGALGVALGVGEPNQFRGAGTRNVEAYEAYLLGMSVLGGGPGAAQAIPYFEQATQIDPSYAAAWAMLGFAIGTTSWNAERGAAVELHDRAYRNLLRATELDPESATAQSILGTFGWIRSDWVGGEQAHARAVALAPSSDGFINNQYGNLLARAGRNSEARAQFVAASRADPLLINNWLPQTYLAQGRFAEAGQEIDRLAALGYGEPGITALRLHVALSAHDSAEVKLRIAEFVAQSPASSAFYAAILADFDSPETVRSTLRDFSNDDRRHWPDKAQDIALLAAYVGDPELALQVMSAELRSLRLRIFTLWHPVMAEARKLPEFKTVVTDLGLVEYWRMYGWPDACRPVGETDFECS